MAEEPTLVRQKRKRSKYPLNWAITPILLLVVAGLGWRYLFGPATPPGPFVLPGYIASTEVFEQENARFYGKTSKNLDAKEKFQLAAESMSKHDFGGAAALLEEASKQAAIPVIFNDLGVLYARLDDPGRTVNAFREALAHDSGYVPVRKNLERLKGLDLGSNAFPVTQEMEPNNTLPQANLISVGKPVDGEIAANAYDVDWYKVTAPVPPRDLMRIEITNKSKTLALELGLLDDAMLPLAAGKKSMVPGESISTTVSLLPNSSLYIKVEGIGRTAGPYTLLVSALKAFDAYEPNEDPFNASRIATGQAIQANIMDAHDTDFYTFVSPRTGTVTIDIQNRSSTLLPALTTYSSDMHSSGFGPDVTTPGAGLRHTIEVQENQSYILQVWSRGDTAGNYTLIVQ
jgi:hypothetical protein